MRQSSGNFALEALLESTAMRCVFFAFMLFLWQIHIVGADDVYIVYMGRKQFEEPHLNSEMHFQTLKSVLGSHDVTVKAMIYSYNQSFSGFAARVNATYVPALSNSKGVVSVFKSNVAKLHTTHSWDFMGLKLDATEGLLPESKYGEDVIIGVIDSGIWPDSDSFGDESLAPAPRRWNGVCQEGEQFNSSNCNAKLIGARWYVKGYEELIGPLNTTETPEFRSGRDHIGHGTHTASTAAGGLVNGTSFMGLASGIARGGAPRARLAIYKACWDVGVCTEADILAAFDDALSDGVDVISVSLGSTPPLPDYFSSASAIASFHAMEKGITVVFSAGNDGPDPSSVTNTAPWAINVAASTVDRSFPTHILLGNNMSFKGEGLNTQASNASFMTLADGASASRTGGCTLGSLLPRLLSGKVVLCFRSPGEDSSVIAALAVYQAGGAGLIFSEVPTKIIPHVSFIPVVYVDLEDGTKIRSYCLSSDSPVVQLNQGGTVVGNAPAPMVAYFSSRGPSTLSPDIMKPDVTAPGVSILAAWSPVVPPSQVLVDKRAVDYNLLSGTSMACPHVSGIVALLKSVHPKWSPAAMRSALMTTAFVTDTSFDSIKAGGTGKPADAFDFGAGHVNPLHAVRPGLVYDAGPADYILVLCNLGYSEVEIRAIVSLSENATCPHKHEHDTSVSELNYPSIAISDLKRSTTIRRTVTNVGPDNCVYRARVSPPPGVKIIVKPRALVFASDSLKTLTYSITFVPVKHSEGLYNFGVLIWSDGKHTVRSPIAVRVNNNFHLRNEYVKEHTHKSQLPA